MATVTEVFARTGFPNVPGTLLYLVPQGAVSAVVTNIVVTNTTVAQQTFSILLDGVEIFSDTEISPNATISMDLKQPILAPSGEITGSASSAGVKLHMSGVVIY